MKPYWLGLTSRAGAPWSLSSGRPSRYFADRRALLEEVLDAWQLRSTEEVIERVDREGGDAMARARRAAELTFSADLLAIDLAVRDWARRDPAVAERLRRVDNFRMAYLRTWLGTSAPTTTTSRSAV